MSDMPQNNPDRGAPREPVADPPMPPTGSEAMQDPAPPAYGPEVSSGEILEGKAPSGRGRGDEAPTAAEGTPQKDPEDWTTGDEPMTGPQRSYLETLAREAGQEVPEDLTKAQASELIDDLQARTGRGR